MSVTCFRAQIQAGEEMTTTTVIHCVWVLCVCISFKHMLMTFCKHVWRHSILSASLSLARALFCFFWLCFSSFFASPLLLLATQQLRRSADVETEMWVYQTPTWTQKAAVFQSLFKLWFLVCVCRSVYVSWLAHLGMLERERELSQLFQLKAFFGCLLLYCKYSSVNKKTGCVIAIFVVYLLNIFIDFFCFCFFVAG